MYGGVGTFVENLAKGLRKIGLKITIVTGYPVPLRQFGHTKFEKLNNVDLNVVRFPYLNMPPRQLLFQFLNLGNFHETIKSIDADVVHGQCGSTFLAMLSLKNLVPILTTFHTSPKIEKNISTYSLRHERNFNELRAMIGYPVMSFVFKKELSNSRMVVAVSKTLMFELLDEMGETHREKIRVIHNGVDIETLDKEYSSIQNEEASDNTILFAGRLYWRKGVMNLIKIAHKFQKEKIDFNIVVHGTGPLFDRMKSRIKALGLNNIELKGFTSRLQLMKSIKKSTCVIIPSFYEACPMILLESMCLGKIPLMFDLPYAREVTQNGEYGILAKNVEDMVQKIELLRKTDEVKNLGVKIRNFARKKFNANETAQKYHRLYKEFSRHP
jgi:glycosyltransferase involved in cell wall biosynthesis